MICLLLWLVYRDMFGRPKSSDDTVKETLEMQQDRNALSVDGLTGVRTVPQDRRDSEDRPQVSTRQIVLVTACVSSIIFMYDGLQVRLLDKQLTLHKFYRFMLGINNFKLVDIKIMTTIEHAFH